MSFRTAQIYIQTATAKRLRLLLRLYPQQTKDNGSGTEARTLSIDELSDKLLNEVINEKYALVKGLEKAIDKTEKEYLESNKQ